MISQILLLMTYPHFFFGYFQDTFHWSSTVPKRFKRNINEKLYQAMITSSDIEIEKDRGGLQSAIGVEITKYDRAGLQIVISFGFQ